MKEKKNSWQLTYVVVCSLLILVAITFHGTYSFFVASVVDDGGDRTAKMTAANLASVSLHADRVESISNMIPNDSFTVTFNIANASDVTANVSLIWKDVINELHNKKDLIYTLKDVTNQTDLITRAEKKAFPSSERESLFKNLSVPGSSTVNYELTVYYEDDPDVNQMNNDGEGDYNKAFGASIAIDEDF